MRTLHEAAGDDCWITVRESETIRYLDLDGCEEGAMFLESEEPVFRYLWLHKASWLAGCAERMLVLGAGAFTAPKCLALDHPQALIDSVDIEPELHLVARRFFRLDDEPFGNIGFHGGDATAFLGGVVHPYDFIFDDLFDGFQHVPTASRTFPHFEQMEQALADGGVCVKNVIFDPLVADTQAACAQAEDALRSVFPHTLRLIMGSAERGHNRLLIGRKAREPLEWEEVSERLLAAGLPLDVLRALEPVK